MEYQINGYDPRRDGSCFVMAVGKDASATGYPMVGHNEDDGGLRRARMCHTYVPPKVWPANSVLPAEKGLAAIPQVERTFGYFWTESREGATGYSCTDAFLNDNGVHLVSNNGGKSRDVNPSLTDGGILHNLRRCVGERATSARHAAQIIVELVTTYGYAASGRLYTVSDNKEIWMVQVVGGKHCVAVRVPDDHVAIAPNHLTVHSLAEYPDVMYPDDLVEYAIEKGWYVPKKPGDYRDFQFAEAYQAENHYKIPYNTYRQGHALRMIGYDYGVDRNGYYPFSVPVEKGSITLQKVRQVLSSHYEGTEDDRERVGPGNNPHDTSNMPHDPGVRRICTGHTSESVICQMTGDVRSTTLWMGYGHPCSLPHIPIHPLTGIIPNRINQMKDEDPAARVAAHFEPRYDIMEWQDSAWQDLHDFQGLLDMVYDQHIAEVQALIDRYMDARYASNLKLLKHPTDQALIAFDASALAEGVSLLQTYAKEQMTLAEISGGDVNRQDPCERYEITFTLPDGMIPAERSLRFGMNILDTKLRYNSPIADSLVSVGPNRWKVAFPAAALAFYTPSPGVFEHILGGRTMQGRRFAGILKINFFEPLTLLDDPVPSLVEEQSEP